MNLFEKFTNLDVMALLENATDIFRLNKYRDKKYVEAFIGYGIQRSFYYGKNENGRLSTLPVEETEFDSDNDVILHIEGIVILESIPVNTGTGSIIYEGYGLIEVGGVVIYDGRGSGGGGTVDWNDVTNKPFEFPPEPHTHVLSNIEQSGASDGQFTKWDQTSFQWIATDINLEDIANIPAFPSDGNDYILVENNGVLTWELNSTGGAVTAPNVTFDPAITPFNNLQEFSETVDAKLKAIVTNEAEFDSAMNDNTIFYILLQEDINISTNKNYFSSSKKVINGADLNFIGGSGSITIDFQGGAVRFISDIGLLGSVTFTGILGSAIFDDSINAKKVKSINPTGGTLQIGADDFLSIIKFKFEAKTANINIIADTTGDNEVIEELWFTSPSRPQDLLQDGALDKQAIVWNATDGKWEPQTLPTSAFTFVSTDQELKDALDGDALNIWVTTPIFVSSDTTYASLYQGGNRFRRIHGHPIVFSNCIITFDNIANGNVFYFYNEVQILNAVTIQGVAGYAAGDIEGLHFSSINSLSPFSTGTLTIDANQPGLPLNAVYELKSDSVTIVTAGSTIVNQRQWFSGGGSGGSTNTFTNGVETLSTPNSVGLGGQLTEPFTQIDLNNTGFAIISSDQTSGIALDDTGGAGNTSISLFTFSPSGACTLDIGFGQFNAVGNDQVNISTGTGAFLQMQSDASINIDSTALNLSASSFVLDVDTSGDAVIQSNTGGLQNQADYSAQWGPNHLVTKQWVEDNFSGGGGISSVTGDGVDNTDPNNPVLSFPNADEVDDTSTTNKFITQAEKDAIATNTSNISQNTTDIQDAEVIITQNTNDISTNATDIQDLQNNAITTITPGTPNVSVTTGVQGERIINVSQTTAGLLQNVYFTGQTTTTTEGTFGVTLISDRGSVPNNNQTVVLSSNETEAFALEFLGQPAIADSTILSGDYSAFPILQVSTNQNNQAFRIEAYLCDGEGAVTGIGDGPVGTLGVNTLLIAESGIVDLQANNPTGVPMSGNVPNPIPFLTGQRFRYVIVAERIGTGSNNKTVTFFCGSDYNSYFQIPGNAILTGFDPNAVHVNESNEFDVITEVVSPNTSSFLLLEDENGDKAKVQIANLPSGSGGNTFSNGLQTLGNGNIGLGGALTEPFTVIDLVSNIFVLTANSNADSVVFDGTTGNSTYQVNINGSGRLTIASGDAVLTGTNRAFVQLDSDNTLFIDTTRAQLFSNGVVQLGLSSGEGAKVTVDNDLNDTAFIGYELAGSGTAAEFSENNIQFTLSDSSKNIVIPTLSTDSSVDELIGRDTSGNLKIVDKDTLSKPTVSHVTFTKTGIVNNLAVMDKHSSFTIPTGWYSGIGKNARLVGMKFTCGSIESAAATDLQISVQQEDNPIPNQHTVGTGTTVTQQILYSSTGISGAQFGVSNEISFAPITLADDKVFYVDISQIVFLTITDLEVELIIETP
jgi:hypothetical protein